MDKEGTVTEFGAEILERLVRTETKVDALKTTIEKYNGLREKIDCTANIANNCKDAIEAILEGNKWSRRLAVSALLTTTATIITAIILGLLKLKGWV